MKKLFVVLCLASLIWPSTSATQSLFPQNDSLTVELLKSIHNEMQENLQALSDSRHYYTHTDPEELADFLLTRNWTEYKFKDSFEKNLLLSYLRSLSNSFKTNALRDTTISKSEELRFVEKADKLWQLAKLIGEGDRIALRRFYEEQSGNMERRTRIFWLAAAFVLFVTGLAVFFLDRRRVRQEQKSQK